MMLLVRCFYSGMKEKNFRKKESTKRVLKGAVIKKPAVLASF
jgi:hypothetical protein